MTRGAPNILGGVLASNSLKNGCVYPLLEAFLLRELRAQNLPRPRECAHQEKTLDMYSVLGIIMRGVISTSSTWFSDLYILALRKMAPSSGHRFKAYMTSCRTTPQSLRVESLNESLKWASPGYSTLLSDQLPSGDGVQDRITEFHGHQPIIAPVNPQLAKLSTNQSSWGLLFLKTNDGESIRYQEFIFQ